MASDVTYDLEVLDDIPDKGAFGGGTFSPLEDQLHAIIHNPNHHAPKWARIGRYANAAAAAAACNTLRKRHGDTQDVSGWRFETRRIDNGEATGLFAQYDSSKIIPGKREENQVKYEEFKARQTEARKARAEAKAKADAEAESKAREARLAERAVPSTGNPPVPVGKRS